MNDSYVYHILEDGDSWYIFQENNRTGYVSRINVPYPTRDLAVVRLKEISGFNDNMKALRERFFGGLKNK